MSAPQGSSYDDSSRNQAGHGQASLTLPPIRSLDLDLSRSEERQASEAGFHGSQAQPAPSGESYAPAPSQPRRDSAYQWRPYAPPSDPGPSGQSNTGSGRDPSQAYGRPYVPDANYSSTFTRDQHSLPTTQYRQFYQPPHEGITESLGSVENRAGGRRTDPAYPSPTQYGSESFGGNPESQPGRPLGRGVSMMDLRHDSRGTISSGPPATFPSAPPSSFAPPPSFNNQSPSFPLSRGSFSAPSYPSPSSIPLFAPHRDDNGTNTSTSSAGAYSHQHFNDTMHNAAGAASSFHPRSWPDRSLVSGGGDPSSSTTRPSENPASGSRPSSSGRWPGLPSPEVSASHSPEVRVPSSGDAGQAFRQRESTPTHAQPHGVAQLSTSIAEIVNHCMALTHFAKHYAERQNQGRLEPEDLPSSIELQQMVQRATAVAQLLDSLRIARLNEEGAATQSMAIPVGSKRSWDASQGIGSSARPLKLIFESGQGLRSVSEPVIAPPQSSPINSPELQHSADKSPSARPTKAQEDLELIKRKRHAATGAALEPPPPPPKAKKRGPRAKNSATSMPGQCASCGSRETPEWRRGPEGPRTLCNACGLHYAKESRESAKESANRSVAQRAGQDTSSTASSSGSRARQDSRSLDTMPLTSPALPTGPSPSTRLAQATSPVRLTYPGDPPSTG